MTIVLPKDYHIRGETEGHPGYEPERIVEEYRRDREKQRADVPEPMNFNVDKPVNTPERVFFSQWVKCVHETTTY